MRASRLDVSSQGSEGSCLLGIGRCRLQCCFQGASPAGNKSWKILARAQRGPVKLGRVGGHPGRGDAVLDVGLSAGHHSLAYSRLATPGAMDFGRSGLVLSVSRVECICRDWVWTPGPSRTRGRNAAPSLNALIDCAGVDAGANEGACRALVSFCLMTTFQGLLLKLPVSTAAISAGSPVIGGGSEEESSAKTCCLCRGCEQQNALFDHPLLCFVSCRKRTVALTTVRRATRAPLRWQWSAIAWTMGQPDNLAIALTMADTSYPRPLAWQWSAIALTMG